MNNNNNSNTIQFQVINSKLKIPCFNSKIVKVLHGSMRRFVKSLSNQESQLKRGVLVGKERKDGRRDWDLPYGRTGKGREHGQ